MFLQRRVGVAAPYGGRRFAMFYYIEGTVAHMEQNLAVIDCGGVGFNIFTTNNTLSRLRMGEKARLYIYTYIREGVFDLYGFGEPREKRSFEMLISVSGVGPKAALSILSSGTPEALAMAVITGDEKVLTVAPGIGRKIAQRIILELKDKISKENREIVFPAMGGAASSGDKRGDAAAALAVLGYGNSEIAYALKELDCDALSLEDIIRQALRAMLK